MGAVLRRGPQSDVSLVENRLKTSKSVTRRRYSIATLLGRTLKPVLV